MDMEKIYRSRASWNCEWHVCWQLQPSIPCCCLSRGKYHRCHTYYGYKIVFSGRLRRFFDIDVQRQHSQWRCPATLLSLTSWTIDHERRVRRTCCAPVVPRLPAKMGSPCSMPTCTGYASSKQYDVSTTVLNVLAPWFASRYKQVHDTLRSSW